MSRRAVTGRRIVEDLRDAGTDRIVVSLVQNGLAAIADRIGDLDREGDAHVDSVSRRDVLDLVDPAAPARRVTAR